MSVDQSLLYAKTHEWLRLDMANNKAYVGISDYAQSHLGEIVFLDLPEPGQKVNAGADLAVVESVKGASDIYAPVSGTVLEVNGDLADNPGNVNKDAYGSWLVVLGIEGNVDTGVLLDPKAYQAHCEAEEAAGH